MQEQRRVVTPEEVLETLTLDHDHSLKLFGQTPNSEVFVQPRSRDEIKDLMLLSLGLDQNEVNIASIRRATNALVDDYKLVAVDRSVSSKMGFRHSSLRHGATYFVTQALYARAFHVREVKDRNAMRAEFRETAQQLVLQYNHEKVAQEYQRQCLEAGIKPDMETM